MSTIKSRPSTARQSSLGPQDLGPALATAIAALHEDGHENPTFGDVAQRALASDNLTEEAREQLMTLYAASMESVGHGLGALGHGVPADRIATYVRQRRAELEGEPLDGLTELEALGGLVQNASKILERIIARSGDTGASQALGHLDGLVRRYVDAHRQDDSALLRRLHGEITKLAGSYPRE